MSHLTASEWLDAILAQRGSRAPPYKPDAKQAVKRHLVDLQQEFPTLELKLEDYTYPDGHTVPLIVAEGTLPVYYLGVKYNIPIALWLDERYPSRAPTLYVRPTPEMVIRPGHALVDASGVVSTPYLSAWEGGGGARPGFMLGLGNSGNGGRSNLVDLCHDTSIQFGADPPLFAKPPGWTGDEAAEVAAATAGGGVGSSGAPSPSPSTTATATHPEFSNPIHGNASPAAASASSSGGGGGGGIWGGALAAMAAAVGSGGSGRPLASGAAPPTTATTTTPPPTSSAPTTTAEDLRAAFRAAAEAGLASRLRGSLSLASEEFSRALAADASTRNELSSRAAALSRGLDLLRSERASLESAAATLASRNEALEAWLRDAETKMPAEWRKEQREREERRKRKEKERKKKKSGEGVEEPNPGEEDEEEVLSNPPPAPPLSPEDADAAIEPADALSAQALATQAEDMATEDTLYALDRALASGAASTEAYLRAVRRLCSRQYALRALGAKIAERQHALEAEAERARAAAAAAAEAARRPPPPPPGSSTATEMPQGDSWCSSGVLANPLASATTRGLGGRRR